MNILVIAPLPPTNSTLPFTGNSLPVKILVDELIKNNHTVEIIDLSKNSFSSGANLGRVFQILKILIQVFKKRKNKDVIYLTVAESFAGNIRDIFIYIICFSNLKRTVIHMLGGAMMKSILDHKNGLQFKVNRFFLGKLAAIIVEGQAQFDTFLNVAQKEKINIISNFAEDFLFINETKIYEKFKKIFPLKILFLSNMLYGKGYLELIDAYKSLPHTKREQISLDFAGGFDSEKEKNYFLEKIIYEKQVTYHGSVKGENKKKLYHEAHIFCLPTYYPYEGQPFSIIEAMAGGDGIITTNHSGIGYIFKDGTNGMEVQKQSVSALTQLLGNILSNSNQLLTFALNNRNEANEKYTQEKYLYKIMKVIMNISN